MEEQLILLFSLLFVLSLVSERLANFLKLQLHEKKVAGKLKFPNLRLTSENKDKEKIREKAVLVINLISGLIIAVSMNISLIEIINHLDSIDKYIGWDRTFAVTGYTIFGWCFTALFLSLGSKFWHDLLGIVWAVKDAKKKIGTLSSSVERKSTADLPEVEQEIILEQAIARDGTKWKHQYSGIRSIAIGRNVSDGQADKTGLTLRFGVAEKGENISSIIPKFIRFENYQIPTDVYTTGGFSFNSIDTGATVFRVIGEPGVCSLRVKRKESSAITSHYFVSCYHVIFHDELFKNGVKEFTSAPPNPDVFDAAGNKVGTADEGAMNTFIDAAIVKVNAESDIVPHVDIKSNEVAKVDSSNIEDRVHILTPSGKKPASIKHPKVKYFANELNFKNDFEELIAITKMTVGGDSGSPVISEEGKVIGIVMGTDDEHTLVVNFQFIINNLDVTPNN
ncbi:MAG: serine protease [Cyclobacteriaceae bacterium]